MANIIPLNTLANGKSGLVTSILSEGLTRRRLLDLGLVPGSKVEVIQRSPSGDPTAFNIRGAIIALRNEDAKQILVKI
ncbi:MAG: ferrous iron transport protein [Clostridia bacterium]|nr:ferrous iron transport protein [Clostridia bacterium]